MSIELLILVYVTFKRHTGLYFWAIIITTLGIILQTTGYILKSFENSCPVVLVVIICKLGWVSNVTGFSIVLWSRLHLVVRNSQTLRWLIIIILINGFVCHTPVVVFEFGLMSKHHSTYYHPMQIMERIQQTVFTLQETVLSSFYIYHTHRFVRIGHPLQTRKIIFLLLAVQLLVVALDAVLTLFDYTDKFTMKCTLHPLVYAVKLKLEFIVLNQLQTLVKRGLTPGLGLPAPVPNEVGKSLSPSPSPSFGVQKEKPTPRCEIAFVAKAGPRDDELDQITPVETPSGSERAEDRMLGHRKHDSDQTLRAGSGDELDLRDVVGTPDTAVEPAGDMERRYLGNWSDSSGD